MIWGYPYCWKHPYRLHISFQKVIIGDGWNLAQEPPSAMRPCAPAVYENCNRPIRILLISRWCKLTNGTAGNAYIYIHGNIGLNPHELGLEPKLQVKLNWIEYIYGVQAFPRIFTFDRPNAAPQECIQIVIRWTSTNWCRICPWSISVENAGLMDPSWRMVCRSQITAYLQSLVRYSTNMSYTAYAYMDV